MALTLITSIDTKVESSRDYNLLCKCRCYLPNGTFLGEFWLNACDMKDNGVNKTLHSSSGDRKHPQISFRSENPLTCPAVDGWMDGLQRSQTHINI